VSAGTEEATAFWSERRPLEMYERYWAAAAQPHRFALVSALHLIPRFGSLREVGCSVGTNLNLIRRAFPWVDLSGSDLNDGAIEFARAHLPDITFRCVDAVTDAASWSPRSVDVIISCYALAYVSPSDLPAVLRSMVTAARRAIVMVEPCGRGLVPGLTFPEWRHDYAPQLTDTIQAAGRKAVINCFTLVPPVDRCDGRVVVTFQGD